MPEIIIQIVTLIGIGGVVVAIINNTSAKKREIESKRLEQKQGRYKSTLLYMDAYFKPEHLKYISSRQSDIDTQDDILAYLEAEYHEMLLYAAPGVIRALQAFIKNPSYEGYLATVINMRKDLWEKKPSLQIGDIRLRD